MYAYDTMSAKCLNKKHIFVSCCSLGKDIYHLPITEFLGTVFLRWEPLYYLDT